MDTKYTEGDHVRVVFCGCSFDGVVISDEPNQWGEYAVRADDETSIGWCQIIGPATGRPFKREPREY
jgi:hypothetical protein